MENRGAGRKKNDAAWIKKYVEFCRLRRRKFRPNARETLEKQKKAEGKFINK